MKSLTQKVLRSLIAAILCLASVVFAVEQNPAGFDAVETARKEFHAGRFDAALRILDQAESRGEQNGRSLDLRGCILMEQGKLEEALQLFERARGEKPDNYGGLHAGDALRRQQKWEEARAAYKTAQRETKIQTTNERLRFAVLLTYLGAKDEEQAREAAEAITFPTESAAYYYAQAAWAFAHGVSREGKDWLKRASEMFPPKSTAWFDRHLYDFGWIKTKPPLASE